MRMAMISNRIVKKRTKTNLPSLLMVGFLFDTESVLDGMKRKKPRLLSIWKDRFRSPSFVLMETYSGQSRSFSVPIRGCGLLGLVLDFFFLLAAFPCRWIPASRLCHWAGRLPGSPTAFIDVVLCHRANGNGCLLRSPSPKESIHRLTYVIANQGWGLSW